MRLRVPLARHRSPQTEPGSPDLAVCVRGFLRGNGMQPDNPRQYLWTAVGFAVLLVVILLIYEH